MDSSKSSNKAIIATVVVVLLVIAATAAIVLGNNKSSTDSSTTVSDSPASTSTPSTSSSSTATLKDGTYSATGSYQTPGGVESIGVKITLTDGTITDASVTQEGKTGEAQEFQAAFASGFKSQVVGKKASEVSLTRVAGSSLTPNGFNNALDDIEKQSQA